LGLSFVGDAKNIRLPAFSKQSNPEHRVEVDWSINVSAICLTLVPCEEMQQIPITLAWAESWRNVFSFTVQKLQSNFNNI
jgi:hypothetical protein